MSFVETANVWIANNQAFVVSVGIPLFTLVITGWVGFLSHRAKVAEVKLNGRVKLSEYRRSNFDELMRLSARLQSLFVEEAAQHVVKSGHPTEVGERAMLEVIECTNLFLLRSHASIDQIEKFTECAERCMEKIYVRKQGNDLTENFLGELRVICKVILDEEWAQIVRELEGISQ